MVKIPIKNAQEIQKMREAGRAAATVLDRLAQCVQPGVNTYDLDQTAHRFMKEIEAESACFNYAVGSKRYPCYTCISVNEEVVHGISRIDRVLRVGDCVSLDVVVRYQGFIGDNARTVLIEPVSQEVKHLVESTEAALYHAIEKAAKPGKRIGDISYTIQTFIERRRLSIVRDFVGHGIGRSMHEEPQIPNFGQRRTGPRLTSGMTLAIEPMVNLGTPHVEITQDNWTVVTRDRKPSAHFEHTVLINSQGAEILTKLKK